MTAKDLLYKILDYQYLWASADRNNSKPAKVRLSQIETLLEGLGFTKKYVNPLIQIKYSFTGNKEKLNRAQHLNKLTNLEYILSGEFLYDREKEANTELSEKALSKIKTLFPDSSEHLVNKPVDIRWMFNNLLNFRQEVFNLTYPNGGMLEGFSVGLHYSFYLQEQLKQIIKDNLSEIDETLWLILDPLKRDLNKDEIGFPEADLESIDLELRMANY